ncbi:MAG: serine hydrolase domain-containing protein, partial [Saprospiraceae bacterium]
MLRSVILCLLTSIAGYSFPQEINTAKLDSFFQVLEENQKFMGSVAVSKDGVVLYSRSAGYRDVETESKSDANTKYRIGSISKTFTTVLALRAAEERKLDLDGHLDYYFPSIPNAEKITIRQLLYHRSGIHDFTEASEYDAWRHQPKTKFEMLNLFEKMSSDFEPDSRAAYSNSNFVLLSYIIEAVYNQSYPEILKENIIDKLGLANTYYGGPADPAKNESYSYIYISSWDKVVETDMSIPQGAGGIVSTPLDMIRFGEALFAGKIISPESLQQMMTLKDDYGMGLFQAPFEDKRGYGHTGSIDGFMASFFHFPVEKISVALISNGSNYDLNNIGIAVLSSVFNLPFDIPVFTKYD